jgi:hypothetical protein
MKPERRDLAISLGILTFVIAFAITGLAFDGNWPKILRVGASFAAYCTVLCGFLIIDRSARPRFIWFMVAGAVTGMVSGLVRPQIHVATVMAQALAGATLIAGAHWLALAHWRRVRARIQTTSL